ncbi:amidohydrolase family protein [Campylobacter novaezeelandiae]|uniref:amidohydrolase family protein n=2 Tax=Campylobacter novaezeelandiae TaxID=2267891 RepID=UPI001905CC71|nr:amidohydrolase family protein [Campylobacter novaezeelandiae]MBK1964570.1 amidohydrolase family protein [Campylobacter novaezeelandiae]
MIIKNAKIYGEVLKDIRIEKGKIVEIEDNIKNDDQIIDAQNLTLLPSFVDLCITLKDNVFSLKHLDALEKQCLKNGICAIVLRDSTNFDEQGFELYFQNLSQRKIHIFPSVKVLDSQNKLRNLAMFIDKGACALELNSAMDANILKISIQYALMKNLPIFMQCYEKNYDNGVMNEGLVNFELGLSGISEISEISEVAKVKELEKFYQVKVLYDTLSLEKSLSLLSKDSLTLLSIHHLIKDDTSCRDFNTLAKLIPPLRSNENLISLKKALKEQKISFLSSIHSPYTKHLKDTTFDEAVFGIDSIEEFVSLCYTFFIKNDLLSWKELCKLTSLHPAEFLGLNTGEIAVGKEANFILFDENASFEIPSNSLYAQDKLYGKIKYHFIKGEMAF